MTTADLVVYLRARIATLQQERPLTESGWRCLAEAIQDLRRCIQEVQGEVTPRWQA